jgi:hypothetical protein
MPAGFDRLQTFWEHVRSGLLKALLSIVYFALIVPLAWRKRHDSSSELAKWQDHHYRAGWHTNEQSTASSEIYTTLSSGRRDLCALAALKGDETSLLIHDVVVPLRFLARPPKEKELSADLYVMF